MSQQSILTALSSRSIAAWVRQAQRRIVYAAPGIHPQPAAALAELASRLPLSFITIRLSPAAKQEAIEQAESPEAANAIAQITTELGVATVAPQHLATVKAAIEIAPPVKFDVVRQVRVFEPYLQYVELSLTGAAVQRHRVRIPKELQNLGTSEDLEGKLKTTFDLIEKGSSLSSKALEDEQNEIRNNFTLSLGKAHGRVVLKSAKPHLVKRLAALCTKLEDHQKKVETELQKKLDDSLKQVVEYYVPKAQATPADALLGSLLSSTPDEATVRWWIGDILSEVFPTAPDLIHKMVLEERNKDVTFETLNRPDFLESVEQAFPRINWDKRRFPRLPLAKAEAGASPGARFLRAKGPAPYQPRATPWVTRRKNHPSPEGATQPVPRRLMDRPFRANFGGVAKPRALPWAGMSRTFCAEKPERDLLFHDTVAPHLAAYAPDASAARERDFLTRLHQTLNAPSHPIRNRLLRLTADSPDLLAIIKVEGKV